MVWTPPPELDEFLRKEGQWVPDWIFMGCFVRTFYGWVKPPNFSGMYFLVAFCCNLEDVLLLKKTQTNDALTFILSRCVVEASLALQRRRRIVAWL